MIVLYYEALKFHENDSTAEDFKAGILLGKTCKTHRAPDIYSPHYIMIASKIREAVLKHTPAVETSGKGAKGRDQSPERR